jgi:Tol biopolymer transport system component
VFEARGQLHLLDLASNQHHPVEIRVVTDLAGLKAQDKNVGRQIQHASISPYGKRVAFEARGEIFSMPAEHGPVFNLTRSAGVAERNPAWSPDGKRIAYWSDAPGASGIVAKQLTGSGETELLAPFTQEVTLKDWARDGSAIFYESGSTLGTDIWVLPLTGDRKPQVFLNGSYNEYDPHLSPNGRYLAYVSNESGREEVYVQTYPDRGEKWQVSTHGGNDPRWSADGREMFYLSPDQQMMSVPIQMSPAFDPGMPKPLFDSHVFAPGNQRMHYSVTADGRTFILYRTLSARSLPTTTVVVNWLAEVAKR